jgi:hypothetical protein
MNKHGLIVTEQEVPFYQRRKVRCTLLEPDRDNERYLFVTVNRYRKVHTFRAWSWQWTVPIRDCECECECEQVPFLRTCFSASSRGTCEVCLAHRTVVYNYRLWALSYRTPTNKILFPRHRCCALLLYLDAGGRGGLISRWIENPLGFILSRITSHLLNVVEAYYHIEYYASDRKLRTNWTFHSKHRIRWIDRVSTEAEPKTIFEGSECGVGTK